MSFPLRCFVGLSLLAAACSPESPAGTGSPASGGAGSPPTSAGATATGGTPAGQGGQAGQTPGGGGAAGASAGTGGSGGNQAGASAGSAGTTLVGGSAGSSGSGPHAGDGCVKGGAGFDTTVTGVVLDRATCLVWERQDPPRDMAACELKRADVPSALCFTAAQAYCDALALDGQSDWRLPTVAELQSLVASPPPTAPVVPTIDHDAFPAAIANLYWSSETAGAKVHCVDFNGGPPTNNTGPDGPQALRCVRGAAAP